MKVASSQHIPVLDGVRAIAVLMVICDHFWMILGHERQSLIGTIAARGALGVDVFFVLSGFLITGILLDSKGTEHFLRNFYVRRVLRIFPLYYATLIALYLVLPAVGLSEWVPWNKSIWFWVYLQNVVRTFNPSMMGGPGHLWSLAVEEHYYLVWPLLVLLLDRTKLLWITAAAIVVSIAARAALIDYPGATFFTFCRLDGLAIGSAVAIFARDGKAGLARFVPWAKVALPVFTLALAASHLFIQGHVVTNTLFSLLVASCLILVLEKRAGRLTDSFLSSRAMGSIGKYSYAMYVFHPAVMWELQKAGLPYNIFGLVVSAAVAYLAAWISWELFERRFLALKRHFESKKPRVPLYSAASSAGSLTQ